MSVSVAPDSFQHLKWGVLITLQTRDECKTGLKRGPVHGEDPDEDVKLERQTDPWALGNTSRRCCWYAVNKNTWFPQRTLCITSCLLHAPPSCRPSPERSPDPDNFLLPSSYGKDKLLCFPEYKSQNTSICFHSGCMCHHDAYENHQPTPPPRDLAFLSDSPTMHVRRKHFWLFHYFKL